MKSIEHLLITANPAYARQAVAAGVTRIFVDLERRGKIERQAGLGAHLSTHEIDDVAAIKEALPETTLLVRVDPLYSGSKSQIDEVIARGADMVMLPMFRELNEVARFLDLVDGRAHTVALFETAASVARAGLILNALPHLDEAYLGLNDLHLDLKLAFMFEPLAGGVVDGFAAACREANKPFGFGGIARVGQGILPGELILSEHIRLGSTRVILSRTFQQAATGQTAFPTEAFRQLKTEEQRLHKVDLRRIHQNRRALLTNLRHFLEGSTSPPGGAVQASARPVTLRLPIAAPEGAAATWSSILAGALPDAQLTICGGGAPPPDTEVLITAPDEQLPSVIAQLPALQWLHLLSAGADRLDALGIDTAELHITTSAGANAASIAEQAILGILYFVKELDHFQEAQRAARWDRRWTRELAGLQLGILGGGAVGTELAARAKALGMTVWATRRSPVAVSYADRTLSPDDTDQVLEASDVVVVLLPLDESTRGLIDQRRLDLMKDDAILVHLSRGGIVDEDALANTLNRGRLRGAFMDVFTEEPLPPDSLLWTTPRTLITPHIAGTTQHFQERAAACFVDHWRAWRALDRSAVRTVPSLGAAVFVPARRPLVPAKPAVQPTAATPSADGSRAEDGQGSG